MKLNGKFIQAAALAALLPAAAMMAGCEGSSGEAQARTQGDAILKPIDTGLAGSFIATHSKNSVGTKNDLTCVYADFGSGISCNWDQANGLVPAASAPAAP